MNIKLIAIHALDIIDDKIFCHRWYWFCNEVATSSWWRDMETDKKNPTVSLSEEEYKSALIELHNLWSAKEGTSEYERFESLLDVVEDYEKTHYPMDNK